jgi:peptide/nickel transport system substrate-binding protein
MSDRSRHARPDDAPARLDAVRRSTGAVPNHVIDEYAAGRLSRRHFIQRATVVGLSLPAIGTVLAACGGDSGSTSSPTASAAATPKAGGTLISASIKPASEVDPFSTADEGGLRVLSQAGEYLTWSDANLTLQPALAKSWSPNDVGDVWTFTLQDGVTFHDGSPMTADDVVATFQNISDPKGGSNALSALGGVVEPDGIRAKDPATVEFRLLAANGNFPYLVSSDNYNAIILPVGYKGTWTKDMIGTGPWVMESYNARTGVTFRKNDKYWNTSKPIYLDTNEIRFYDDEQAWVLAIQGGEINCVAHYSVTGGRALLTDPNIATIRLKSAAHRQVHMRTDQDPFKDKAVRQAMAYSLDRPGIIQALFNGEADLGNDSPFAPLYPSTDTSVPQRTQDLDKAKSLLQQAGVSNASVDLYTWNGFEIPQLAQLLQDAVKQIGVSVKLNVLDAGTYYSDYWLNSKLGITDYGHRGVPNVFLGAPLLSTGTWNAAHFKSSDYDSLVTEYLSSLDEQSQKAAAKQIEELLLDETPLVIPYFYNFLTATQQNVVNVQPTAMGHLDVTSAGFTS